MRDWPIANPKTKKKKRKGVNLKKFTVYFP
jgi:hypothetical protein